MRCASATRRGRISLPSRSSSPTCSTSASSRSTSACAPTARSSARPISTAVRQELHRARADGIEAVAIVFMHAYRYSRARAAGRRARARDGLCAGLGEPRNLAADQARRPRRHHGGRCLSLADHPAICGACGGGIARSPVASRHGLTPRHGTRLRSPSPCRRPAQRGRIEGRERPRLMFMMSSGGLTAAELFQGKDAILSGPAGGVVGMAETGREAGFEHLIGFDMGGTSTDVSHYDGSIRAHLRNRSRRRAHARADDADPHGRGRRRLDPAFRRRALPRRARIRPAPIPGRHATAAAGRSPSPMPTSCSAS